MGVFPKGKLPQRVNPANGCHTGTEAWRSGSQAFCCSPVMQWQIMRGINCELLLNNHTQKHRSIFNLFVLFFIAKKSIFRQLTPVWILPNLMYAILRFISFELLYRQFPYREFRLFVSQIHGCYSRSEKKGGRKVGIKSQYNKFCCTFLTQINLMSQFPNSRDRCIDR